MPVSRRIGRLAIAKTRCTLSSGIASFCANSSGVGSRPIWGSICREVRTTLLTVSMMRAGTGDRAVSRFFGLRHFRISKATVGEIDSCLHGDQGPPLRPAESLSARPATALTLRGAASQIASAENALHPAAIQNAAE